jgi:hypothetical protein
VPAARSRIRPRGALAEAEAGAASTSVANRNFSEHTALLCVMSASLAEQFEDFAKCCLELARAETTPRRARFTQMAHEYLLATSLISKEHSPDLNGPPGPTRQARIDYAGLSAGSSARRF